MGIGDQSAQVMATAAAWVGGPRQLVLQACTAKRSFLRLQDAAAGAAGWSGPACRGCSLLLSPACHAFVCHNVNLLMGVRLLPEAAYTLPWNRIARQHLESSGHLGGPATQALLFGKTPHILK